MPDRIIFARHGQTPDNLIHRLSTSPPGPPLTDVGVQEARDLAAMVRERDIAAIFTTPLVRARQTADIVAEGRDIPVFVLDGLRELSVGSLEGRNDEGVFEELDRTWNTWTVDGNLDLPAGPGGETARQVLDRSLDAMAEVAERYPTGTVLVVAHSGILQLLIPAMSSNLDAGFGYRNWLRNCQLVEIEADGAGHMCVAWADVDLSTPAADPVT